MIFVFFVVHLTPEYYRQRKQVKPMYVKSTNFSANETVISQKTRKFLPTKKGFGVYR